MYSKDDLLGGLTTQIVGTKVFVFETIDSTNTCARALGEAGTEEGAVVIADYQTSGRGRLGRTWLAEPNCSLLFSVLLRPPVALEKAGLLTLYASAAIARAVEQIIEREVECKWPNDLLLNGKKFCGILLENSFQQAELTYSVLGAGLNVNQTKLPDEISGRATSLAVETGRVFERKDVFQSIIKELDTMYAAVRVADFSFTVAEWNRRCSMFGKTVTVEEHNHLFRGVAIRLHDDGGLILETEEGQRTVYAGDVSLVA